MLARERAQALREAEPHGDVIARRDDLVQMIRHQARRDGIRRAATH